MFSLYFIWVIGLSGMNGLNGLSFDRLEDGIIVTRGNNMSIIEGEWTLLLTIHEDGITHGLAAHAQLVTHAQTIWNIIEVQNTSVFFTRDRRALMKAKIDLVTGANQELTYQIATTRDRRGILDFIGQGLELGFRDRNTGSGGYAPRRCRRRRRVATGNRT